MQFGYVLTATVSLILVASADAAVVNKIYTGPNNGGWNTAANWSPSGVPNNGADTFNVFINSSKSAVNVAMNTSPTISNLTVDQGDSLTIQNVQTLTIANDKNDTSGVVTNNGVILLNSGSNATYIRPSGGTIRFLGSGELVMNNGNAWIYRQATGSLVNGANHTIRGAGNIGWSGAPTSLINNGLIRASHATVSLNVQGSAGVTNNGLLLADGGTLFLDSGTFTNADGVIEARNGSIVEINANIENGVLLADAGSTFRAGTGTPTLQNLENMTTFRVPNARDLFVSGTILNDGRFSIDSASNSTFIYVNDPVFFDGSGEIVLSNVNSWLYRNTEEGTLTNGANHTIRGTGNIGRNTAPTPITNNGLIKADSGGTLFVQGSAGVTNNNLLLADGGTLFLDSGTFTNADGVIEARNGSVVEINANIENGVLLADAGSTFRAGTGTPTLQNLENMTTFRVPNARDLFIYGTILNDGRFSIDSGFNSTEIYLSDPVLFDGSGEIVLTNNNSWLYRNTEEGTLTNGANHTIRGTGNVGWNGAPTPITNNGLIMADSGGTLVVQGSAGVTNNNLLLADGGTLFLSLGTFSNADGVIEARNGSIVEINASVENGVLLADADSTFRAGSGTPSLQNLANTTTFRVPNSRSLRIFGTIVNDGRFSIDSGFNSTEIYLSDPVLFDGSGEIVLTNGNSWLYRNTAEGTLTNGANHTIRGTGNVGWSGAPMPITNDGSIVANGAGQLTTHGSPLTNNGIMHVTGTGSMSLTGTFANHGQVTVDPTRTLTRTGGTYIQNAGTTTVNGTLTSTPGVTLNGGSLKGSGQVNGAVNNIAGSIQPGNSAGILSVTGNVTMGAASEMRAELAGTSVGQYDRLAVTGSVSLNGHLSVKAIDGFNPQVGQQFTIITSTGPITGTFATAECSALYQIIYNTNSVVVQVTGVFRPADLNCDGTVGPADLGILLGSWGTPGCGGFSPCPADLNGDGSVGPADLGALLGSWG